MLNMMELAETAVKQVQAKGLETLSQEQFDALFLMARGMGAIKTKYAKDEAGLTAALMQENIMSVLGIGLDKDYIIAKNQLQARVNKRKEKLPERYHAALDALHMKRLVDLRNEFKVDESIERTLHHYIHDKKEYEKRKTSYTQDLGMDFIEEDIDVKVKRESESKAEFKTKQKLNEELGKYKALRKDYLDAERKITAEYDEAVKKLYDPIQENILQIEREYESKLRDHDEKYPKFSEQEKTPSEQEKESKELIALEEARENIIQERERKIKQARESIDVKEKTKKLKEEKERKSNQNKAEHKDSLKKADALFDDKIIPLMKELKSQTAHKMFVVIASQMSSFIEQNSDMLKRADSNTIAFVVLLKDMVSDFRISGILHHAGMKAAKEFIEEQAKKGQIPSDEKEKENILKRAANAAETAMTNLAKKGAKKVSGKIGEELGTTVTSYSKEAFAKKVEFLEKNAALRVPQIVKENHPEYSQTQTFADFMPEEVVEDQKKTKDEPKSFFDFIDYYNEHKGVLGGISTAHQVYKALSVRNPDLALMDAPNTATLFAKALEDDALSFNYKLLVEYEKLISTLKKHDSLGHNGKKWEDLLEKIQSLKEKKEILEERYVELKDKHVVFRKKYTEAEVPYHDKKAQIEKLKEQRVKLVQKIEEATQKAKAKELNLFEGKTQKLENAHDEKIKNLNKEFSKMEKKIKREKKKFIKAKDKALKEFREDTKDIVVRAMEEAYRKKYNYIEGKLASREKLTTFCNESNECKENIAKLLEERTNEMGDISKRFDSAIQRANEKEESALSALEEQKKPKIKEIENWYEKGKANILKEYKKYGPQLIEFYKEPNQLLAQLGTLDETLESEQKALKGYKRNLIDISREFYTEVDKFNESKAGLNQEAASLIDQAINLDPAEEPHLLAMQGMLKAPHKKVKAISKVASTLTTIIDEVELQTMSYDAVAKRVVGGMLEDREVKEVMSTAEEKSIKDRVQENLAHVGAHSIVEALSSRALSVAKSYVSRLDPTLQAEEKLAQTQKDVNEKAEELRKAEELKKAEELRLAKMQQEIDEKEKAAQESKTEIVPIVVEPQKSRDSALTNFFKGLWEVLKSIGEIFSKKSDKKREMLLSQGEETGVEFKGRRKPIVHGYPDERNLKKKDKDSLPQAQITLVSDQPIKPRSESIKKRT